MTGLEQRAVRVLHDLADGKINLDEVGNLIRDLMHELRLDRNERKGH